MKLLGLGLLLASGLHPLIDPADEIVEVVDRERVHLIRGQVADVAQEEEVSLSSLGEVSDFGASSETGFPSKSS